MVKITKIEVRFGPFAVLDNARKTDVIASPKGAAISRHHSGASFLHSYNLKEIAASLRSSMCGLLPPWGEIVSSSHTKDWSPQP